MRLVWSGFELINLLVDFGCHGIVHMYMYILNCIWYIIVTCRLLHIAKKTIIIVARSMFNGYEHKTNRVGTKQTYGTFIDSGYLKERKSSWTNLVLFEGRHAVHVQNLIIIMKMKIIHMFVTTLFRIFLLLDKCMFKKVSGSRCL